jgi:hypothetical protein
MDQDRVHLEMQPGDLVSCFACVRQTVCESLGYVFRIYSEGLFRHQNYPGKVRYLNRVSGSKTEPKLLS